MVQAQITYCFNQQQKRPEFISGLLLLDTSRYRLTMLYQQALGAFNPLGLEALNVNVIEVQPVSLVCTP